MARKSPVRVTQDMIDNVHKMLDSGAFSYAQVGSILNISTATISVLKRCKDMAEYRAFLDAQNTLKAERNAKQEHTKEIYVESLNKTKQEPQANNYQEAQLDRIIELLVEQNKTLKQIALVWGIQDTPIQSKAPF